MLTVGEMVMKKWRDDLHAWIESCDPTPWYQFPQVVLAETLSELGIWDAEVLEGRCDNGLVMRGITIGGDTWPPHGFAHHEPVRVIVLKEE